MRGTCVTQRSFVNCCFGVAKPLFPRLNSCRWPVSPVSCSMLLPGKFGEILLIPISLLASFKRFVFSCQYHICDCRSVSPKFNAQLSSIITLFSTYRGLPPGHLAAIKEKKDQYTFSKNMEWVVLGLWSFSGVTHI